MEALASTTSRLRSRRATATFARPRSTPARTKSSATSSPRWRSVCDDPMNFDYNEEQQLLAASVKRFIDKDYTFEARRKIVASSDGYSNGIWSTFAEIGLLGLPFSPDVGGFGGGAVDLMSVMEASGEALVVEPYLSTVALSAQFVARAGTNAQRQAILPLVGAGKLKMAFAQTENGARYKLAHVAARARSTGAGYTISGEKRIAVHAPCADQLIVSARTSGGDTDPEGISVFVVDARAPGVSMNAYRTIDELGAADVTFTDVRVPADALVGQEAHGLAGVEEVVAYATALLCA